MAIEHACFISFPRGVGNDTRFAQHFYDEFVAQLGLIDKSLSVFKFDRCEERRQGDDWSLWIQRELCSSAMMLAVCAPNYFKGSPACVSEFRGMEQLIAERNKVLGPPPKKPDWLLALRLKDSIPMPALNPYPVRDFLDCAIAPEKVRTLLRYRRVVSELADLVYEHWSWIQDAGRGAQLHAAGICRVFRLPPEESATPAAFPFTGGVR